MALGRWWSTTTAARHLLLLLGLVVLVSLPSLENGAPGVAAQAMFAPCGAPRVRQAWGAMTPQDQQLYVDAVAAAMTAGHHALFTELHAEMTSATELYKTCGFLYWNRRFVLAYETMLRSLGPQFACVTVPYWDYFADYARFLDGKCTSIQSCAAILTGLGGSAGPTRTVVINGKALTANCVQNAPVGAFCENSTLIANSNSSSTTNNASSCARCLPRADWSQKKFPAGFGYGGLGVTLAKANGFRELSNNIQYGVHNSVHNTLASTMATYMSAADPIFYSHHATIDLLHQIYLDCQLGLGVRNNNPALSRWAFQKCTYSSAEVCPGPTSNVTQLWKLATTASDPVRAELHPTLGRFFADLPTEYWRFVTIRDLGNASYEYQKDDLIANLQKNGFVCPKLGILPTPSPAPTPKESEADPEGGRTTSTPSAAPTSTPTSGPTPSTTRPPPAASTTSPPSPSPSPPALLSLRVEATTTPTTAPRFPTPTVFLARVTTPNAPRRLQQFGGFAIPSVRATPSTPTTGFGLSTGGFQWERLQQERGFIQKLAIGYLATALDAAIDVDGTMATAFEQVELMECLHHHETYGGVEDYSPYFRDNYDIPDDAHPRCFDLVQQLRSGAKRIRVSNWRDVFRANFAITAVSQPRIK